MTLEQCLKLKNNNFDFLRFFAASCVIFSHCFAFVPGAAEYFYQLTGWETAGGMGVYIFFTISGFLIFRSWHDNPQIFTFLRNRFLRIFPGLAASVFFCVIIIGPLATSLPIGRYFKHPDTRSFFLNLYMFTIHFTLPGVFTHNHFPNAVNGSLWTLPIEGLAYGLVLVIGALELGRVRNLPIFLLLAVRLVEGNFTIRPDAPSFVISLFGPSAFSWLEYFLMGMIAFQYRDKIVLNRQIGLILLAAGFVCMRTKYIDLVMLVALPYAIFCFAYRALPGLNHFGKYGDFSYGLYIYAFPIQQLLAAKLLAKADWFGLFVPSFVLTLAVAVCSWRFIEKPMLRLKHRSRTAAPAENNDVPSATPPLKIAA